MHRLLCLAPSPWPASLFMTLVRGFGRCGLSGFEADGKTEGNPPFLLWLFVVIPEVALLAAAVVVVVVVSRSS
jgi:hypothetical protein